MGGSVLNLYFIHYSLIIKNMFGLFFLNWFTADKKHVYLYFEQWKSKNNKLSQSITWPKGNSIVQTAMWEFIFVGENYNVSTNVFVYNCIVRCILQ